MKEFLNLTMSMQLLYFITTVISKVHSARHHQGVGVMCYTERLVHFYFKLEHVYHGQKNNHKRSLRNEILEVIIELQRLKKRGKKG